MAKVLLVEDDNNLREIYEARLQAEGYDIVAASDGEEALAVAKNENPDLIISDVMMPKISGFEMLDILRNTAGLQDVKVIMLTALGQADDQQRANKLGADRYLVKSQVTLEDIVKAAQELLEDAGAVAPETTEVSPTAPMSPLANPPMSAAVTVSAEPAVTPDPVIALVPPIVISPAPVYAPEPVVQAVPDLQQPAVLESVTLPVAEPTAAAPVQPVAVVSQPPVDTAQPDPVQNVLTPEPGLVEALNEAEQTANSAAAETADVTAQIESFVAQTSAAPQTVEPSVNLEQTEQYAPAAEPSQTEQAVPAVVPDQTMTPVQQPAPNVEPAAAPSTDLAPPIAPHPAEPTQVPEQLSNPEESAAHDQVMQTAMDALNGSQTPVAAVPSDNANSQTPELDSAVRNAAQPSGKRIIAPLSGADSAKPDLQALLAAEEAKEALANAAPSTTFAPTPFPQPTNQTVQQDSQGVSSYLATPPISQPDQVIPAQPVSEPVIAAQVVMPTLTPPPVSAPYQPATPPAIPIPANQPIPVQPAPIDPNQPRPPIDPSSIAL